MKRKLCAVTLCCVIAGLLAHSPARAQIEANLESYTGKNAEGYLTPLTEGFGSALQSGVFRSAAIPKDGFHINVEIKTSFITFGDDDKTFTAVAPEGFFLVGDPIAPTVVGSTESTPIPGQGGAMWYPPAGLDIGSLGLAVPQITIGSLAGTQGIFRYIAFDTGDAEIGSLSLLGLGARHSISQHFKSIPFDLAGGLLWQKFQVGDDLIDASAFSIGVQGSKRYSVLEPYASLSLDTFKMSVEYDYKPSQGETEQLSLDFDQTSDVHFAGGLGINLSVVHIHGEIGISNKTSYALGLSVGN